MKSFTDLEQSKKLAEFLPIESADMRYGYIAPYDFSDRMYDGGYDDVPYPKDFLKKNPNFSENEYDGSLPCWSLSALLELMPSEIINDNERYYFRQLKGFNSQGETYHFEYISTICTRLYETYAWNNPIDSAFEMIIWLLENKKL